jgi:hypothetical protein
MAFPPEPDPRWDLGRRTAPGFGAIPQSDKQKNGERGYDGTKNKEEAMRLLIGSAMV